MNSFLNIWTFLTRVAGVSFDGRQEILESLSKIDPWRMMRLIYTTYNGETAIQVLDISTQKNIGWIPKSDILLVMQTGLYVLTGCIYSGKSYYVRLYIPIPPSLEQYKKGNELCIALRRPIPIYDIRPYTLLLQQWT